MVHGTKENLLEHLHRELNILQMHNKWNQIVLTRGVSDMGFPIFADTDADFAF